MNRPAIDSIVTVKMSGFDTLLTGKVVCYGHEEPQKFLIEVQKVVNGSDTPPKIYWAYPEELVR